MSEKINGHNTIGQVSPSGHQMTVVVLHMATPADWNKPNLGQTGKDKFVKAIEKAMNAHSRVETGPGGAVLMGMFVRTDAPGDAGVIDKMRTEYPLADSDDREVAMRRIRDVIEQTRAIADLRLDVAEDARGTLDDTIIDLEKVLQYLASKG